MTGSGRRALGGPSPARDPAESAGVEPSLVTQLDIQSTGRLDGADLDRHPAQVEPTEGVGLGRLGGSGVGPQARCRAGVTSQLPRLATGRVAVTNG